MLITVRRSGQGKNKAVESAAQLMLRANISWRVIIGETGNLFCQEHDFFCFPVLATLLLAVKLCNFVSQKIAIKRPGYVANMGRSISGFTGKSGSSEQRF